MWKAYWTIKQIILKFYVMDVEDDWTIRIILEHVARKVVERLILEVFLGDWQLNQ